MSFQFVMTQLTFTIVCVTVPFLARRIDCFSEMASNAFGEKMKEQVEERLRFYDEGVAPMKNITAMQVCLCTNAVTLLMQSRNTSPG